MCCLIKIWMFDIRILILDSKNGLERSLEQNKHIFFKAFRARVELPRGLGPSRLELGRRAEPSTAPEKLDFCLFVTTLFLFLFAFLFASGKVLSFFIE